MRPHSSLGRLRWLVALAIALAACGAEVESRGGVTSAGPWVLAASAWGQMPMKAPNDRYFVMVGALHQGGLIEARDEFDSETRSGTIKSFLGPWVDSICTNAMAGEACFHLGEHPRALRYFDQALRIYLQNANWLMYAQFQDIRVAQPGVLRVAPWGGPKRPVQIGAFNDTYLMAQGQPGDVNNAIARGGGVVQTPVLFPLHVAEVVRCTALAIKRRRDILGPLSPYDALNLEVLTTLSRRPGQPNHWSEAWVSLQLGMAFSAMGKDQQAKTELERSILAAGRFDHPLSSYALLDLGRMAMQAGEYDTALNLLHEASASAVTFRDPAVIEEAFRLGNTIHLGTKRGGMFPPLPAAIEWARRDGNAHYLYCSLSVMAAENYLAMGQNGLAERMLEQARTGMARTTMLPAKLGARYQTVLAQHWYQLGQREPGDAALTQALNFARNGGLWLAQIALTDNLKGTQPYTARVTMDVYTSLLRDPTPIDWSLDPLESLSVMHIPHSVSYENWFSVALERKEYERALEIADLAKRHRFLSGLDLGGRVLNLRWTLESPLDQLDRASQVQRQDLLTRYPGYSKLGDQARKLRDELRQMPLAPDEPNVWKTQGAKLNELAEVSAKQEVILREIAVRREHCPIVFPPFRSTKDVQKSLPNGHGLLAFFATGQQLHAFLMTNDKYGYWPVTNPAGIKRQLDTLLRQLGNWDANKQWKIDDLRDESWRKTAGELFDALWGESKADSRQFQELVVVPDGYLWYLPFEALAVRQDDKLVPFLQRTRLRYAPLNSLGVGDTVPRRPAGNLAVVLGRLYPQDDAEVARSAFEEVARAVPGSTAIQGNQVPASNTYASLFDRLLVLTEITPVDNDPLGFFPLAIDNKGSNSTLMSWLRLPWGGPEQVFLPGFHTVAENTFKKPGNGQEIFQAVLGFMATGSRTVVISRWRPGGHTSIELMRELAQELPYTTAAAAWQRAVRLVSSSPLDPTREPRIAPSSFDQPPSAEHPFFWSAYLLVDTGAEPLRDDDPPADGVIKVKDGEAK